MNTTVKVFIVLTLVMTVAFMFVQMTLFATRENWKRRWDSETRAFAKELKESTSTIVKISAEKAKADYQRAERETEIKNLQVKLQESQNEVTQRDGRIQNLEVTVKKWETDYNAKNEEARALGQSLEMVRQRNGELQNIAQVARAVAFNLNVKLTEVEDDLNHLQSELARRNEDLDNLRKGSEKVEAVVAQLRSKHPQIYNDLAGQDGSTKYLRGQVAAVRTGATGEQELVTLTIGKAEGVEEGIELIVFRGGDYVCKVRVERVLNDLAHCRVLSASWNRKGLKIEQGDNVQNRL